VDKVLQHFHPLLLNSLTINERPLSQQGEHTYTYTHTYVCTLSSHVCMSVRTCTYCTNTHTCIRRCWRTLGLLAKLLCICPQRVYVVREHNDLVIPPTKASVCICLPSRAHPQHTYIRTVRTVYSRHCCWQWTMHHIHTYLSWYLIRN